MVGARNIWNDYRFQHMQASKLRELRTKEDTLNAREEALNAREAALNTKEQQLAALEQRLKEMQQRLGQATDAATAAAAAGGGGGLTSIPSNVDLNSQAVKASYDAAKIQAYRRRVSMGRQTEQMNIDDDDDYIAAPVTLDDVPPPPSTSSSTSNGSGTTTTTSTSTGNANAPPLSRPPSFYNMPPPPSATTTATTTTGRRGPVPVPSTTSATAAASNKPPSFKILADAAAPSEMMNRVAQQVYGSAPVYETAASHKQQRQPLQTLKIATGAENAKENIQPPAAALPGHHNVFKFAANGGVHKPHGRALPYDFQPDAEDTSPLKKQRVHSTNDLLTANNNHHHMGLGLGGGFRYPSSNAVGDYLTSAPSAAVTGAEMMDRAKKMFR
jgi:hypothetical protein